MMLGTLITANYAAGIVAVVAALTVLYKKTSSANVKNVIPLPPGPPACWFWRNALPSVKWVLETSSLICETDVNCSLSIARALTDLVREYGPVVSFRQGSQVIIVICSVEVKSVYTRVSSNNNPFPRQLQPLWRQKVDP
jgi:hypothetical protein